MLRNENMLLLLHGLQKNDYIKKLEGGLNEKKNT